MHRLLICVALVTALLLRDASGQSSPDPYLQGQRQKAASMLIGKEGVSRSQAELLAEVYFFSEVSGCGGPDTPVKRGGDWIVPVRVGYAGALHGALRIRASTGAVSYAGHPTRVPREFAKPLRY